MSWSRLVPIRKDKHVAVAPSVLSADFSKIAEEVHAAERAGADLLHLDVMDGHFVPVITFGPMIVNAIRKLTDLPLDTHLMIRNPDEFIPEFAEAGSDIITVHIEASSNIERDLKMIRDKGKKSGVTLNPDTNFDRVVGCFGEIDMLLVMSVFPGYAGQSFMPEVLPKIKRACKIREEMGLDFAIEIDGGITSETAPQALDAGTDILVAGSAVFKKPDYTEAIRAIREAK